MLRKTHLVILLILLSTGAAVADPELVVTETNFNFGRVGQNSIITHGFWLKSVGDETVRIKEVFPGCGCTKIPLPDSTLAPGDSLKLEIMLNTQRFFGFITKKPYIEINNTKQNLVHFHIYAEIVPDPATDSPLVLNPPSLDVSQFTVKPRRRAGFEIINKTPQTFKVTAIDTTAPGFTVYLPSEIGPNATASGKILVNEDAITDSFQKSFTFEATSTEQRLRYTIPVMRIYRPKDIGGK